MKVPEPRKVSSGKWFIQLRLGGKSVSVSDFNKKECIRQAQLIKAEYQAGKREIAEAQKDAPTLGDAIDRYVESKSNVLSPSTIRGYVSIRKNRLQAYMGLPVDKIDWQKAVNGEATECCAKTLKNVWGLVSSSLEYCGVSAPKIRLPQVIPHEKEWLEPEQLPVFIEAVKDEDFGIPALLALQGLRRSEIYALDWDCVDLDGNTITVKGAVVQNKDHKFVKKDTTKTAVSSRTVPIMIPELSALLRDAQADGKPLVSGTPEKLYRKINRVCEACGLPAVGVHGLRHSFASLGYYLGIPEREMMELGGWEDSGTMQKIYTHVAAAARAKSQNKLAEYFSGISGKENAN